MIAIQFRDSFMSGLVPEPSLTARGFFADPDLGAHRVACIDRGIGFKRPGLMVSLAIRPVRCFSLIEEVDVTVHWSGFTNAGNNGTKVITGLSGLVMTVDSVGLVDESSTASVDGGGPGVLIVWPAGETVWSDTIRVSSTTGLRIVGGGIKATTARWVGSTDKPGFKFDGTQDCGLGQMRITIGSPGALTRGGLSVTVSQASKTYTRPTGSGSFVDDGFGDHDDFAGGHVSRHAKWIPWPRLHDQLDHEKLT